MKKINCKLIAYAVIISGSMNASAASPTVDKIKSSGAVTMGVRESSIPMSYTTVIVALMVTTLKFAA